MTTSPNFRITSIAIDAVAIELIGDIDASNVAEIARRIVPLAEAHAHLEIDLRGVTFLDSDGAAPLIDAAVAARRVGDSLVVTGWSAATRHLRDSLTAALSRESV